jgi:hypothetical protein
MMLEPQSFLDGLRGRRIVLDEIRRLQKPSELLKIAADHYPRMLVVATGLLNPGRFEKIQRHPRRVQKRPLAHALLEPSMPKWESRITCCRSVGALAVRQDCYDHFTFFRSLL